MYQPTQRTYRNAETGEYFRMYHHPSTGANKLINETTGREITMFYACAFTGTDVKLNTGEVFNLSSGEFVEQTANRKVTHKKFFIQKRFTKI
jgi:hypothetical protein